jgi:hypothetical protein
MLIRLFPISKRAKTLIKSLGDTFELVGKSDLAITIRHESGYYGWLFLDTDVRYEEIL